jgi:hypothetical protein
MPAYAYTYLFLGVVLAGLGFLIGIPLALREREARKTRQGKQPSQQEGKRRDPATT